ncbi:MAG TPA: MBOAT family O-acyltransferase [Candidatus Sulfotelmatobacter sp.]|nr:MBOAT family O-acyltransferase [Candidatus Sulfotelmatobacter sp.]
MLFDTPIYLVFLTLVVLLYWRLSWRRQNFLLLCAGYFFYGWWDWRFLLLMICSTIIDYVIALRISEEAPGPRRRALLIISLFINFGLLGFFKYCNFFVGSLASVLGVMGARHIPLVLLKIILPPGISFYTFQEVAYVVDVYKGRLAPSRSFLDYGLFITLFPHLIAGPIQRPSHLLPQVQKPRTFDDKAFFDGCALIIAGLFRKTVIADSCANLANLAFDGRLGSNFFSTLIGVYAFAWQIYGDFSGYSDIARGSAQLLGFHFMLNFRQPYFARSLQDFWRRWHISLSTWLRDYLYIPLGGNRQGPRRTYVNLMITMLLGGLWHGANWTFVIWGGIHGAWLTLERLFWPADEKSSWFHRGTTLVVVGITWIFFRARSLGAALEMIRSLGVFQWQHQYGPELVFLAVISSLMMLVDWRLEVYDEEYAFQKAHVSIPVFTSVAMAVSMILFAASETSAFIYFQF